MKTLYFYFGLLLTLSLTMTSCLDDDSGNTPINQIVPPTSLEFNNLRTQVRSNLIQTFTFDMSESDVMNFTSEKGVQVTIYGSCLTFGGEPLEGEIEVTFIELFDKGNLLSTNIATMGKHLDGSLEMLISGGAFYLNVYQNGEPVEQDGFCGYNMQIPSSLTGGTDYDMTLWYGNFDENGNLAWEEANTGEQQGGIEMSDDTYYVWASQFGWTNVDRFYNDPRPKTTIYVQAPSGYNATNSAVYLSYDGEDTGLARLDTFENGLFSEHYGLIPIGLECHVIFVSEFNGEWVYAIKAVTVAEDEVIEILYEELNTISQQQLITLINGLP